VRDYQTRGYSAAETLSRWESVSAGEEKNIFPFMANADVVFNTSLDYETSVLKTYVTPLLKTVRPDNSEYNLARNLLNVLDMFLLIPPNDVPPTSLLREFIGGSFFEE
jgi:uridine kinase